MKSGSQQHFPLGPGLQAVGHCLPTISVAAQRAPHAWKTPPTLHSVQGRLRHNTHAPPPTRTRCSVYMHSCPTYNVISVTLHPCLKHSAVIHSSTNAAAASKQLPIYHADHEHGPQTGSGAPECPTTHAVLTPHIVESSMAEVVPRAAANRQPPNLPRHTATAAAVVAAVRAEAASTGLGAPSTAGAAAVAAVA